MNAMQMMSASFVTEAHAYMARHDLPPESFHQVRGLLAQKAYRAEIEPYLRAIANVMQTAAPSYLLHKDGRLEQNGDGLTDSMRKIVASYQGMIDDVRAKYGHLLAATLPEDHQPSPDSLHTSER